MPVCFLYVFRSGALNGLKSVKIIFPLILLILDFSTKQLWRMKSRILIRMRKRWRKRWEWAEPEERGKRQSNSDGKWEILKLVFLSINKFRLLDVIIMIITIMFIITWHSYSPASASCGRWIFNVHVSGLASALCKGTNLIFLDHDTVDDYDHDHYHGDDDVDDEMKMMISKRHLRWIVMNPCMCHQ